MSARISNVPSGNELKATMTIRDASLDLLDEDGSFNGYSPEDDGFRLQPDPSELREEKCRCRGWKKSSLPICA